MALHSLFDDFPILSYVNGGRRRVKPAFESIMDLTDRVSHKIRQDYGVLPALSLDLDDEYEHCCPGKKRKVRSGAVNTYEPKSKVVVTSKDNKFKIYLDTSNYQPDEITVKVVNDKIAISAKHEAKGKDVYEFHEMYRSFDVPENVDPNTLMSDLSATGLLTVIAPLKTPPETTERTIHVEIEGKGQQAVEASKSPSKENNSE